MAAKNSRLTVLVGVICVLAALVVVGGVVAMVVMAGDDVEEGTVLELTLDGGMSQGPTVDIWAELSGVTPLNAFDVRRALRVAAQDEAIAGLLVQINDPALGNVTSDELVEELRRFGESKPVHVLVQTDMVGDGHYFLSTAGTRTWVTPEAMWVVNGYQVDVEFWKGTFEKLHIEPEWIMFKEYKSAGEPFSRDSMSEYMREAMTDVIGDLQRHYIDQVAARRGVERSVVRTAIDKGMFTGRYAKSIGLIDDLGYLDEVQESLRELAGTETYESMSLGKYLGTIEEDEGEHRVAVVFGEGQIVATSGGGNPFATGGMIYGPDVAAAIREAHEDEAVKAIVFRVDSPGGSAVGSDLIWREIARAREKGIPVVVSMANVAGSGGYWVSMGADAIVASPVTITGSIGVVFGKFNVKGFYEWIGANIESIKFAENSDVLSPAGPMTEVHREAIVGVIDELYTDFKRKVSEGRGIPLDGVERLAKGRIWSGADAQGHKLVDELGGIDVAIGLACDKASIERDASYLVVYPEQQDFWELLLSGEMEVSAPQSPQMDVQTLRSVVDELTEPRVWALTPDFQVH